MAAAKLPIFKLEYKHKVAQKRELVPKHPLCIESETHFSESHYHSCSACPDHTLQSLLPLGSSRVVNQVQLQKIATGVKPSLLLKCEDNFSLAAEPTKDRLRVGLGSSSGGWDESGMEVLPVLDTQHNVGVNADISSEGQADIHVDGSPSPPSSQYSFRMDSAPLPEGLDFGMGLTPLPGAPEWGAVDVPRPREPDEHLDKPSAAMEEVIKDISQPKDDDGLNPVRHTPTGTYDKC